MSHYTEEEQIAQLKDWWRRNGKPLMIGGILALALVFGWQTWQKQQMGQSQKMSTTYQQLLEAAFSPDGSNEESMLQLLQELEAVKPDHAYTQYARLLLARAAVQQDRLVDAAAFLRAVVDKPANDTLGELSRQRLARVLAASDQPEEALALLQGNAPSAFRAARAELRGDLLVQLGRTDDARAAYLSAREQQDEGAASGLLQMKLDDLTAKDA